MKTKSIEQKTVLVERGLFYKALLLPLKGANYVAVVFFALSMTLNSLLFEGWAKLIYRWREMYKEGLIKSLVVRYHCFSRKLKLRQCIATLKWVDLQAVRPGHIVTASDNYNQRLKILKNYITLSGDTISLKDQLILLKSNSPIKYIKEDGVLTTVEGNGRTKAMLEAGIKRAQVLVYIKKTD